MRSYFTICLGSLPLGQLGFAHRGQELVAWDREFRVLSEDAFWCIFHGAQRGDGSSGARQCDLLAPLYPGEEL